MHKNLSPCSLEKTNFRGWDAFTLRNGLVNLVAVPDIGGRIMAFDLGDYPFFFVDPDLAGKIFTPEENQGDGSLAAWKNYGGDKTWPSPQGWDNQDQWPGPPDPILDTGRYQVKRLEASDEAAVLQMVSPSDSSTGIQISRQITLHRGGSRATLDLTFTNVSNRPVRWSIWDVTQLRAERTLPGGKLEMQADCSVTAPLNPKSRFPRGFYVMFGDVNNSQWGTDIMKGLFVGQYRWEIGKVGIDSPGDWIAFSNGAEKYAFTGRYKFFPGEEYPDQGATVECWTVGKGKVGNFNYEGSSVYLMEVEVLSPFYTFKPGDMHSFRIEWEACRCAGPVVNVTEAGCTHQPLEIERTAEELRLTGSFGVFDVGSLQLVWKDGRGVPFTQAALEDVNPMQVVQVDRFVRPPVEASSLELQVVAVVNQYPRVLAVCKL